jgi:hypothetical protein
VRKIDTQPGECNFLLKQFAGAFKVLQASKIENGLTCKPK